MGADAMTARDVNHDWRPRPAADAVWPYEQPGLFGAQMGDVGDEWSYGRAKTYAWALMRRLNGGRCTPCDMDGLLEINACFLFFEGKVDGQAVSEGQMIAYRALVNGLPERRSALIVGTHPRLPHVEVATELSTVRWYWRDEAGIAASRVFPGRYAGDVWRFFNEDAERRRVLDPASWERDLVAQIGSDW